MLYETKIINLDVDTNVDFMAKRGKLYVPNSESITQNIGKLTQNALINKRVILSPSDAHYGTIDKSVVEGAELDVYGEHCIKGTPGAEKIPESLIAQRITLPSEKLAPTVLEQISIYQQIIFEKQSIDVFYTENNQGGSQNFEKALKLLSVKFAIVYGVVSHICVLAAVLGVLSRGIQVCVVTDAIKELDAVAHQEALDTMEKAGAKFITTEQVTTWSSFQKLFN